MTDLQEVERRITLRDLHVLMTVVQSGSMLKGAQRLHTSQPAISRSIASLEQAVGARLLDRNRKGVEPTVYGRALLDCGTTVFDELRQGLKNIGFLADPTRGKLKIGGDAPAVAGVLPATYVRFRRRFPLVEIDVMLTNEVSQQQKALRKRTRDLIFGRIGQPIGEDFETEILFQERSVVVAGVRSPWARKRRQIELKELADARWTLPTPESVIGALALQAFQKSGLDYPPKGAVIAPQQMDNTLIANEGFLGLLPTSLLRYGPRDLAFKVLPVKVPIPPTPFGVMRLKGRTLDPIAHFFTACARDVTKRIAQA